MPEMTATLGGLLLALLFLGFILGWILRGGRIAREKAAINSSWQDQVNAQGVEKDRLAEQNKNLMEQIGQYQASKKDSDMRAKELSEALKEAFQRRDELQGNLKDIRSELEVAMAQREKARASADSVALRSEANSNILKEKDQKIFKLSREIESWRNRLPPLTERYRQRDLEAQQLEVELQKAEARIAELENAPLQEGTRIEPVGNNAITNGLDASNDQYDETSAFNMADTGQSETLGGSTLKELLEIDIGDAGLERVADTGASAGNDEHMAAEEPDTEVTASSGRDDLQRIKGVGPAIEKTLNGLGFFRFRQIAEMSEYDINRVASQLRGFRSRIYREDWIGQARMLQVQDSGDLQH